MSAEHQALAWGLVAILAKASRHRPAARVVGHQLGLFDRPVPVQAHVRHDATGAHLVQAHVEHRARREPAPAPPRSRAPAPAPAPAPSPAPTPAAKYVAKGLKALKRAIDQTAHPDVARALRMTHDAVASIADADDAAAVLEHQIDALRIASTHPAPLLRAAGDRIAEATRSAWQAWRQAVAAEAIPERRARLRDRVEMHDLYQPFGAPRPGERGYQPAEVRHPDALDGRDPAEVAATVLEQALALREDPDVGMLLAGEPELYDEHQADEEDFGTGWTRWDLPDLFGVPMRDPTGRAYAPEQRLGIVEDALLLAAEVAGEGPDRDWWPRDRELPRGAAPGLPATVAAMIIEDALQPVLVSNAAPRIVLVGKEEAVRFIQRHHSKLPKMNARGLMYTIGLRVGGRLVAVATAGSPGGRWTDPHRVLDVTRIASDATYKGASSALMARLMELVDRSRRPGAQGPSLLVTYSLANEAGTTYRALADKGLRPVVLKPGKVAGGARGGDTGALEGEDKIRWEYGEGAGPADWSLLAPAEPAAQL